MATKKRKKAKAPKKAAAPRKKRKANAAFMRPVQPDADLAVIVGDDPLPRTQIVKEMWVYIKKHKLQEGRTIHADENLKPLFGRKNSITMFELAKVISAHVS